MNYFTNGAPYYRANRRAAQFQGQPVSHSDWGVALRQKAGSTERSWEDRKLAGTFPTTDKPEKRSRRQQEAEAK